MELCSGGIEFSFPQREGSDAVKASYLLYAGEYKLIQALLRFLLLLDVEYPHAWTLDVGPGESVDSAGVAIEADDGGLRITNGGDRPVLVLSRENSAGVQDVDALIDAGGTITLRAGGAGRTRLRLQTVRDLDMIVPRSRSTVRHRAERPGDGAEPESMWDVVFDLGTLIHRGGDDDAEARLRHELEQEPTAAAAAAALGAMLLKRQDFAEAGRWLRVAYNGRDALPDGGRRVRMQLRELARRLAQRGAELPLPPPEDIPAAPASQRA